MSFLAILANLLVLAAFVAYIWLVVVAFKHSTLWGLLVLFLSPITAVIFAIKNWEDSKRPFLIYTGSCVSAFAIGLYIVFYVSAPMMAMVNEANRNGELDPESVAQSMNTILDRVDEVGNLDENEKAELDNMRRTLNDEIMADANSADSAANVSAADLLVPRTSSSDSSVPTGDPDSSAISPASSLASEFTGPITPDGYQAISLKSADKFLGETVRILEYGGRELLGKLKAAHEDRLILEKAFVTGTFEIEVVTQDVEALQIFTR